MYHAPVARHKSSATCALASKSGTPLLTRRIEWIVNLLQIVDKDAAATATATWDAQLNVS